MAQESGSQGGKAQAIKSEIPDELVSSAEDVGISVDDVVESKMNKHAGYDAGTIQRFVVSDLRQQIESEKAEGLTGIIMGSRDRYGKNWPRRHSLLRSSGEHIEVSAWDGTLPDPNGDEVQIPAGGAKVDIRCDYDEEYDSYQAKRIDAVQGMELDELSENLSKIAVTPDELTKSDEYEVVVVEGTISWVDAQTVFEDGEPSGDGPILVEDGRGELQPHFELSLGREGDTSFRGHVERQNYGRPYFAVTDLMNLVTDAYEMYESPSEQAGFVRDGIQGMDVIVVGNINNYDKQRDDDGNPVNYVDAGVTAIVEVDADSDQTSLQEAVEDEPDGEDEEDEEDEGGASAPDLDDVIADIEQYAGLVGEDVGDLTTGDIQEGAKGIEAPESVIDHALRQLRGDDEPDDEPGDEPDDEPGDEPEEYDEGEEDGGSISDLFEPLMDSGLYQCPGDDCPGKGSSPADLLSHVMDEHGLDSPSDAKDWVAERV